MRKRFLLFVGLSVLPMVTHAQVAEHLMAGKSRTPSAIVVERLVAAPPAEVFSLWITPEGVRRFFAPDSRIEPVLGGRYEMIFAPDVDPSGLSHGTAGARIVGLERGRFLAFEWISFAGDTLRGPASPPFAEESIRNARPIPTWIEVSFDPVPGSPNATKVRLTHYGFADGDLWERARGWFTPVWSGVLSRLAEAVTPPVSKR